MKFPVIAFAGVTATVIGIAGFADGNHLRKGLGDLIASAAPELVVPFGNVDDSRKGAREPGSRDVAQAETPSEAETPPPDEPAAVDESALRYFASQGDTARLQAEISRLRALYPNWTPPEDPLAVPRNEDVQLEAMWQLYAEGRYAEVRKAIADRRSREAGWQPPADLLERLDVAEARARLVNASDLKQYETVIQVGASTPILLTCSEVDVLWRVAEAFAETKRQGRARDAYLYILKNCDSGPERLATLQKAAALLPYSMVQELLSYEKPNASGTLEFESIRDDLARRFVAEGEDDATLAVDPKYLQRVERLVETQGTASDALLLGWYHLRRKNMSAAEQWFRRAREKQDSASASQGLALTLIDRKAPEEAEKVLYPWRDASADARATYMAATANLLAMEPPVILTGEVLQRIAQETIKARDPATAQQFGWYARTLGQPQTALQWFSTALSWKPDDEPSAYGLAITRHQLGDTAGTAEIQRLWAGRSERIARLGEPEKPAEPAQLPAPPVLQGAKPNVAAGGQPADAVVRRQGGLPARVGTAPRQVVRRTIACRETLDPSRLSPQAALARGWCLMDMNRPLEAVQAFEVALRAPASAVREDAAYGQSLAYLRAGLTSKAAVAATKSPQSRARVAELQTAILADRAIAAFDAGRYRETLIFLDQLRRISTERTDLMVLRGYAYLNLNRFAEAKRIFEAAAATGNRDARRGLADVSREQEIWPNK
ncbi:MULTISPECIES: tetratricopeptide repeat protein [Sinorhizobium]|uniref:tetratricopeptide repeat protein n=1 Tax=Sinorhizobium TaxID=28105 RepID=UPI000BEA2E51|nr:MULTISPECIES: tetratricopeptide repeat protein [Sinorhizobium]PDT53110.1 cellulose synthase [Sinorhizobium sp. NG07B]POH29277.1 cellulose synthase [Sinorhizobium americanum]